MSTHVGFFAGWKATDANLGVFVGFKVLNQNDTGAGALAFIVKVLNLDTVIETLYLRKYRLKYLPRIFSIVKIYVYAFGNKRVLLPYPKKFCLWSLIFYAMTMSF